MSQKNQHLCHNSRAIQCDKFLTNCEELVHLTLLLHGALYEVVITLVNRGLTSSIPVYTCPWL